MTRGTTLRQRLGSLSSGRLKLAALGVLLVYAIVMLWPYLAATLVRGSVVTAWVNVATAPIPGRATTHLPYLGSQVGPDGVIIELINEQLDPGTVPRAEAVLAAAQARNRAARAYLEGMLEIDGDRPELMKAYAVQFRKELDADIAAREARFGLLRLKVAAAGQLAERTKTCRSAATARATIATTRRSGWPRWRPRWRGSAWRSKRSSAGARRRTTASSSCMTGRVRTGPTSSARMPRPKSSARGSRSRRRRRPSRRPSARWPRCAPTTCCRARPP